MLWAPAPDVEYGFFYPWLLPLRGVYYDALHEFVHPHDGYRLSDRIWRADAKTRNMIDQLLAHEIRNGTSAVRIAQQLEGYLRKERKGVRTKKPYGRWGSYDARRLARTEVTAAAGRAVIASSQANPFVELVQWDLSNAAREDWDCNCEANSSRDVGYGPGVYPVEEVPDYPDHPHCMCTLLPVVVAEPVVEEGRTAVRQYEGMGFVELAGLMLEILELWGSKGA